MHPGLENYIEKLEGAMAEGDVLLAARDPSRAERVRERCTDAVALVCAYQIFVHRELFEPLMRGGDESQRHTACELKAECIMLTDELRTGIKNFMAQEMPFDWDYLSSRVQHFNMVVRSHIARVRALMSTAAITLASTG
ncbi:MAG: hypothetical protein WC816_05255 [Sphingomonas sp.]|jgi:hypothetical protein